LNTKLLILPAGAAPATAIDPACRQWRGANGLYAQGETAGIGHHAFPYQFVADRRVSTLYSADYSEGTDLSNFLQMAVRNIAQKIALAKNAFRL